MLATFIEKTLGRSCSSSDAVLPAFLAASYSARAASRSLILAMMTRVPTVIFMP